MSAETTLLPVARPRPLWLAGLGALLVLAVLIGGVILVVSRSGGGRVVADDPGGPLAAGSRSADPPGVIRGGLEPRLGCLLSGARLSRLHHVR